MLLPLAPRRLFCNARVCCCVWDAREHLVCLAGDCLDLYRGAFKLWGRRSSRSHAGVCTCAFCKMPLKTASQELGNTTSQLPGAMVQLMGPTSFSPEDRTTLGRTRIPGPQIMADRIKGHTEVTFQGACLPRGRAKWKRSEHF